MTTIVVDVVRAWPRRVESVRVVLPSGATVADALRAAGLDDIDEEGVAIFGERVGADARLADGDRVELLRPLAMDPKQARRERAARAGRG